MMRTSFYLGVLFCSLMFSAHINPALAQEAPPGFSIDPFYQSIDIPQGQASAPFVVSVKNTTANPVVFRISVLDFGTFGESGGVAFLGASDNLKYGLASWISLPNDTLVLKPGETQTVNGTIDNKESLSPGGHYGAIYFKIVDDSTPGNGQSDRIAFNPSFASLLFVKKLGGEVYGLNLDNQDFSHGLFSLPGQINLRFQNTGNVHIVPRGSVDIYDPFGRQVRKSIINTGSGIILPESFRVYPGTFMNLATVFWPGRYSMVTSYRYDGKPDFLLKNYSFILVPPLFILALILLVLALIVVRRLVLIKKLKK